MALEKNTQQFIRSFIFLTTSQQPWIIRNTIAIFCDLRKAFDTVNIPILLNKFKKMCVRGVELLWFQDYLTNRKQLVHINGSNSLLLNILIGVPQGSILGPLLF